MAGTHIEGMKLEEVIRNHIERVLDITGYNQSQTARILGLPLSTLRSKIKKLGIETKGTNRQVSAQMTPSLKSLSAANGARVSGLN